MYIGWGATPSAGPPSLIEPPLKLPNISIVYAYCWSAENPVNPGVLLGVCVTVGVGVLVCVTVGVGVLVGVTVGVAVLVGVTVLVVYWLVLQY